MNLTKITDRHNTPSLKWLYSSLFTISLLANDKIIALIIYISRKLSQILLHNLYNQLNLTLFSCIFVFPSIRQEGRRQRGTGAELRPALVSGNVTGDDPVSYWSIFFVVPGNGPRSLFETLFGQFPSRS